jgi:hypothetical protein
LAHDVADVKTIVRVDSIVNGANHVSLGDKTHERSSVVDDRQAADVMRDEQPNGGGELGAWSNRDQSRRLLIEQVSNVHSSPPATASLHLNIRGGTPEDPSFPLTGPGEGDLSVGYRTVSVSETCRLSVPAVAVTVS